MTNQTAATTQTELLLQEILMAPSNETLNDRFNPTNIAAGCGANGCGMGCNKGCGGGSNGGK